MVGWPEQTGNGAGLKKEQTENGAGVKQNLPLQSGPAGLLRYADRNRHTGLHQLTA